MVFFCCSSCGESLKKNQVNKHYIRCRMSMVSCLDCNQEFWGDDFNTHIKCISEDEKYSGKDFKPTQNKGEAKQDAWLQKVQSAIDSSKSKPHIRKYLEMLKDYPNIPRKQSKFENFVNNSLRIRDKSLVQDIWSILMTENTATTTSTTTTTTTAVSKEDKNSNNGVGNSSTEMMAVEEEGEGGDGGEKKNKKESKREKKAKRSEKQNKKEKKDRRKLEEEEGENDEDEVMECDGGGGDGDGEEKKKKKKNKKRKHEAMEIDSENSMKKKKKKKKAGKTEEIDEENNEKENEEINGKDNSNNDEDEEEVEEEEEEEEEEEVKRKRKSKKNIVFDWEQSIVTVLKKKQDQAMSLKKVGKKVIAEFLAQGGYAESNDKLRATFTKKVTKNPRFICVKDEVRLSKNR